MNRTVFICFCTCVTIAFLTLVSCKKEYEKLPYNIIEQFLVDDGDGNTIKAVIGADQSILLYWPPFHPIPDSINPVIVVSENASVSPASGHTIALEEGTVYTVTAENGTVSQYHFKPMFNNPVPEFYVLDSTLLSFERKMIIRGEHIIPDTSETRLYLTGEDNNDIQIYPFEKIFSTTIETQLPQNVAEGYYYIKMVSGRNTVMKGPYKIRTYDNPFANNTTYSYTFNEAGQTLAKGSNVSFSFTTSGGEIADYFIARQRLWLASNVDGYSRLYEAERVSLTENTVVFRLPDDLPAGNIMAVVWVESSRGIGGAAYLYLFNGNPVTTVLNE